MARGEIYIRLPDGEEVYVRTDLTGHGVIHEGEEFTARELWPIGKCQLMKGGRKMRVRVTGIEKVSRIIEVEVLQDLTPAPDRQENLFG